MNRFAVLALPALVLCGCADKAAPPDAQEIIGDWWVVDFHSPAGTKTAASAAST